MNANDSLDEPITDLPFPLESFPSSVASWLEATARQARVPLAFVAFPFLACTGAVLGNQASIQVSPGWTEWPALWVALVAPSGHGKTPAIAAARAPFTSLHAGSTLLQTMIDDELDEMDRYRAMGQEMPPEDTEDLTDSDYDFEQLTVPSPLFISTSRVDYLTRALSRATGLCLVRDELASLVHTVDRGRGEDHQTLLSLWSSEPVYSHDPDVNPVLNPVLSVVGGLQPRLFHRARHAAQDGLFERFLLVYPESARIPRDDPGDETPDAAPILALLQALRPIEPVRVTLSPEAAFAWSGWFGVNIAHVEAAEPGLDGFYRKFPAHVARIALILHALWNPNDLEQPLSEATLRHAIALAEFLRPHTRRVSAGLGERRKPLSPVAELSQRILGTLRVDAGWVPRTDLRNRVGRPEISRFNRVIASLTDNEAIEVSRETVPNSRKPVTFYRLPPRYDGSNEVRS